MAQDILHRRHTIPVPHSTRRRQAKSVASYLDEKPPREAGMGARGRAQPRFDKEEARLRHFRTVAKAPTRPALTLPAMRPHEDDEAQKRHAVKDILEHSDPELLLKAREEIAGCADLSDYSKLSFDQPIFKIKSTH